jgi:hypothetical protein
MVHHGDRTKTRAVLAPTCTSPDTVTAIAISLSIDLLLIILLTFSPSPMMQLVQQHGTAESDVVDTV